MDVVLNASWSQQGLVQRIGSLANDHEHYFVRGASQGGRGDPVELVEESGQNSGLKTGHSITAIEIGDATVQYRGEREGKESDILTESGRM